MGPIFKVIIISIFFLNSHTFQQRCTKTFFSENIHFIIKSSHYFEDMVTSKAHSKFQCNIFIYNKVLAFFVIKVTN